MHAEVRGAPRDLVSGCHEVVSALVRHDVADEEDRARLSCGPGRRSEVLRVDAVAQDVQVVGTEAEALGHGLGEVVAHRNGDVRALDDTLDLTRPPGAEDLVAEVEHDPPVDVPAQTPSDRAGIVVDDEGLRVRGHGSQRLAVEACDARPSAERPAAHHVERAFGIGEPFSPRQSRGGAAHERALVVVVGAARRPRHRA
ncbi:MAG TPA: hypothetical protein VFN43_03770 [Humibacillus sp.]|nr:hypothetical protein [Humibacillus sp.]